MSYKHRGVLNSKEVPAETRDAVTSSALSDLEVLWKNHLKPKRRFAELQVVPPWRVGAAARGGRHSAGEHAVVPPGGKAV